MNLTITVGGVGYAFETIAQASNRDCMALEEALGVTFESFMKGIGRRFTALGKEIEAVKAATPEGVEPDLSDIDTSLSARDMTALVFLARRRAGENTLAFDDVEFALTDVQLSASDAGTDPEQPDPNADPTDGSGGTTPEPNDEPSPSNA